MREFYTKASISLLILLLASVILGYWCGAHTFLRVTLLPSGASSLPWHSETNSDAIQGGLTSIKVDDDIFSLSFDFTLSHHAQYPNATVALVFDAPKGKTNLIDLSKYDRLSFSAKCSPSNILMFSAVTLEDKVSVPDNLLTYRAPATFFSCDATWSPIEIDLTRLETPQWWFNMFKLELSKKEYKLDKVSRFHFGNSFQSPFDVPSKVQLQTLTLSGRNWFYMYLFGGCMLLTWGGYALWFFRQHTRALVAELRDKIQRDRPLVAYQQLSVEPHRDKDKSVILHFMATEYANGELSLESMAAATAVSRTKINDILKAELGFTFTTYLNKLRLTEAARLLSEKEDANIAEIAYSVGYKNVSYFNKLFKEEYGCTPKSFKSLCDTRPGEQ